VRKNMDPHTQWEKLPYSHWFVLAMVACILAKCNMTVGLPMVFLLSSWNDLCICWVPFLPMSAYYVAWFNIISGINTSNTKGSRHLIAVCMQTEVSWATEHEYLANTVVAWCVISN
jgi:hypothetical protein